MPLKRANSLSAPSVRVVCSVSSFDSTSKKGVFRPPVRLFATTKNVNNESAELYDTLSGYKLPTVQWYPGHIAKAERQLAETLRAVDVVVEVRDARICKATSHTNVGEWCAGRPRIVVLTHVDQIPKASLREWQDSYEKFGAGRWDAEATAQVRNQAVQAAMERTKYVPNVKKAEQHHTVSPVENVLFVNAKQGQGIHAIKRAIFKAGAHVQERRQRRGLKERALRVGIIGYPNVGKSALINRLLGRRRARTANTPGVTRALQWIRVRSDESKTKQKEFELLDSPGIIPANLVDQNDACLLAACNCIGQASYDNQAIAAFLCEWLKTLHIMDKGSTTSPDWRDKCLDRYGFDPLEPVAGSSKKEPTYHTGEAMLYYVADNTCRGDPESAARKILQDFRAGRMGSICLQLAPETESDDGQARVRLESSRSQQQQQEEWLEMEAAARQERAQAAMETAKQQGLELPPMVAKKDETAAISTDEDQVGKGLFDGW